ncbi:hypothetical protein BHS09_18775 [Myxococcus xanthus]|uniref:Uncharacterized protein n=1 Tax=Myxococcus xanthus TaxID=34 RepID=A0AAE6KT49_MYXXA|nr:hypothetical protein BHS09_18775 [Myxococcus xanthus]QDE76136.1 hypothetical protein BHS08_18790 [Myxococcus xanthus]
MLLDAIPAVEHTGFEHAAGLIARDHDKGSEQEHVPASRGDERNLRGHLQLAPVDELGGPFGLRPREPKDTNDFRSILEFFASGDVEERIVVQEPECLAHSAQRSIYLRKAFLGSCFVWQGSAISVEESVAKVDQLLEMLGDG